MSFLATKRLPHRIPPSAYSSADVLACEVRWMRQNTWQLIGTKCELENDGDFITGNIFGTPVIVRNFDSQLTALSNVCAHRHSLIRSERCGHQKELSCQYHGWCYGSDGLTRRIPSAKDFAPIDRASYQLPTYRCDTVGQLVFVALSKDAPTLKEYLGPLWQIYHDRCGIDHFLSFQNRYCYRANWKVAIENTLEAYHIQCVHPETFRTEPGEQRSVHQLNSRHSSFRTDLPFAAESRIDRFFQESQATLVKLLGRLPNREYEHHHLYPNLLTSFTDAITLVQSVTPVNAHESESVVYQFGILPHDASRIKRLVARTWAKLESMILRKILKEDFQMLPKIQLGLEASPHTGVLGRCEERIASFQNYWCDVIMSESFSGEGI